MMVAFFSIMKSKRNQNNSEAGFITSVTRQKDVSLTLNFTVAALVKVYACQSR